MAPIEEKSNELRERWLTSDGRALQQRVFRWLSRGGPIVLGEIPRYNGRLDFRGMRFLSQDRGEVARVGGLSARRVRGNLLAHNARVESADFSYAEFKESRFIDCEFTNCRFFRTTFVDLRMWGTALSFCEFERCDLRSAVLGGVSTTGRACSHKAVRFLDCDLRRSLTSEATFSRSSFENSKFCHVDVKNARFIDCSFKGLIDDATFYNEAQYGDAMQNADFSNARFRMTALRRYNFRENDGTRWPNDPNHIVVNRYEAVLLRMLDLVRPENPLSRGPHAVLQSKLKWIGPTQDVGLFSLLDYDKRPDTQAFLRSALVQAVTDVGARVISGDLR